MNHPLLNIAVQAARNAGKLIARSLDHLEAGDITQKQRNDFATRVDVAAEEEIIAVIREAYPEHAILAEESGEHKTNSEVQWIIDPLDGTTNFIHGIPHFAVSIAVKVKHQLDVGMIFDPIKNELFVAARGRGAMLNNRKIRVSSCQNLDAALLVTGLPFRDDQPYEKYMDIFKELMPKISGFRRFGSAALDLAYVAAGRFDGYFELGMKPWDIAAGALIVKEAGGLVTDTDGKEEFLKSGNILAANFKMHPLLLKFTKA